MPISGFTMAEANNILKRDYLPVVREQIPQATPLFNRIKKGSEDVVGEKAYMALHIGRNQGVGARSTTDPALPKAGNQKYVQISVDTRNIYGRIEISGKVFKAARNNTGAFLNAVEAELKGLTSGIQWDVQRQLFGDGTGTLATIQAAAGGALQLVVQPTFTQTSYPTRWVAPNMRIEVRSPNGAILRSAPSTTVLSVDKATNTVTIDVGLTSAASAGDIIVREGSFGQELTGLSAIMSPTSFLYGVDRSLPVNAYFRPQVFGNAGTFRPPNETLLQLGLDESEVNAGGKISLMISDHGVRRAYQDLLMAVKRFVEPKRLAGGYTSLDYNGIDWVADPDTAANTIYMLDESTFKIHTMIDALWDWGEEDNQVLRQVTGYDSYEAFMVGYFELVCDTPAKNVVIKDVTEKTN